MSGQIRPQQETIIETSNILFLYVKKKSMPGLQKNSRGCAQLEVYTAI